MSLIVDTTLLSDISGNNQIVGTLSMVGSRLYGENTGSSLY